MSTQELNEAIEKYVRPDSFPVGIMILRDGEPMPAGTERPSRDMGVKITICQAVAFARHSGWTIVMGGDDLSCPIAQVAFGYEDMPKFTAQERGMYMAFPLGRAPVVPDVLVVSGLLAFSPRP